MAPHHGFRMIEATWCVTLAAVFKASRVVKLGGSCVLGYDV